MQVLNYDMVVNAPDKVLAIGGKVLALTTTYDPFVFPYYEESGHTVAEVLAAGLPHQAEAGRDYLRFQMGQKNPAGAALVWSWLRDRRLLTGRY